MGKPSCEVPGKGAREHPAEGLRHWQRGEAKASVVGGHHTGPISRTWRPHTGQRRQGCDAAASF